MNIKRRLSPQANPHQYLPAPIRYAVLFLNCYLSMFVTLFIFCYLSFGRAVIYDRIDYLGGSPIDLWGYFNDVTIISAMPLFCCSLCGIFFSAVARRYRLIIVGLLYTICWFIPVLDLAERSVMDRGGTWVLEDLFRAFVLTRIPLVLSLLIAGQLLNWLGHYFLTSKKE